jgi:hypothetical protein
MSGTTHQPSPSDLCDAALCLLEQAEAVSRLLSLHLESDPTASAAACAIKSLIDAARDNVAAVQASALCVNTEGAGHA